MLPDPLHPAVVHLPLVAGFLLPLALAWGFFVRSRTTPPPLAFLPALFVGLLLAAGALLAASSGEDQEDRVEGIVGEEVLEEHEEAGEQVRLGALILVVLLGASFLPKVPERGVLGLRVVTLLGSLILLPILVGTGESGGELVYRHGAASAYTDGSPALPAGGAGEEEDDD